MRSNKNLQNRFRNDEESVTRIGKPSAETVGLTKVKFNLGDTSEAEEVYEQN